MSATGYTPISLYYSTTASAVPVNTNLVNGELALNITDKKLYAKDNTGTVFLLASATGASATVQSVSVVSANGLAGTVATATTTPAITLSTTVTGLLKGNGTAISAASSGTDYAPATSGSSILYGNGAGGFSNVTIGSGISFAGGTLSATGSGGTVTSVNVSGGTTGLTTSGGPVTGSGTITLAGTLASANGGTGVNNGSNTITLGGNISTAGAFTTSGAFGLTLTTTALTNVTLPTSGTLVNTAVTTLSSLASIGTITSGTWNGSIIGATYGGTGVNNGSNTITLGGNVSTAGAFTTSGAFGLTLTTTALTNVTLPTSGTLVNTAVTSLSSLATVGTITSGTWNASVIGPAYGGTGVANNAASTITISGNFGTTFTVSNTTSLTLPTTGTVTTNAGAVTLTNKRIDPRVSSTTSASSVTPDISAYDEYAFTALAATLTINAPIGTPVDGDKLIFRILDSGSAQTLSWNATYTVIGVTLPTTTTASKTTYVGCIYNANNTRWDVVAVTTQA